MLWSRRRFYLTLPMALIVLLVLTGCGAVEQELTIYADQSWESHIDIGVHILFKAQEQEVATALDQRQRDANAHGVEFAWERLGKSDDGATHYAITAKGSDRVYLDQMGIHVEDAPQHGYGAVQVVITPNELGLFSAHALTLCAQEVLETNGATGQRGQVQWRPLTETAWAYVIPKSKGALSGLGLGALDVIEVGVIVGAVVLIVVVAVLLTARRRSKLAVSQPVLLANFCPYCGGSLSSGAKFCLRCGKQVPERKEERQG